MNIYELADLLQATIIIRRFPNPARFQAKMEDCDVLELGMVTSEFGSGLSAIEAVRNYSREISNKTIVFDVFKKEKRREFKVPKLEEVKG